MAKSTARGKKIQRHNLEKLSTLPSSFCEFLTGHKMDVKLR